MAKFVTRAEAQTMLLEADTFGLLFEGDAIFNPMVDGIVDCPQELINAIQRLSPTKVAVVDSIPTIQLQACPLSQIKGAILYGDMGMQRYADGLHTSNRHEVVPGELELAIGSINGAGAKKTTGETFRVSFAPEHHLAMNRVERVLADHNELIHNRKFGIETIEIDNYRYIELIYSPVIDTSLGLPNWDAETEIEWAEPTVKTNTTHHPRGWARKIWVDGIVAEFRVCQMVAAIGRGGRNLDRYMLQGAAKSGKLVIALQDREEIERWGLQGSIFIIEGHSDEQRRKGLVEFLRELNDAANV